MNFFKKLFSQNKEEMKLTPTGGTRVANFPAPGDEYGNFNLFGAAQLVYPKLGDGWRFEWLKEDELQTEAAGPLYKNIIKYVPPVSRAFNAWRRSIFTDWQFIGTTPQMQAYIDNMFVVLEDNGNPFDTLLEKAGSFGYWGGALFGEIAIDSNTREFVDFKLANPFRVRFKPVEDPERGFYYEFGIHDPDSASPDNFKSLEGIPTVLYQILNPSVGEENPYAQPFIDPAVPPTVIFFPMLFDMRAAYKGQAMPRPYFTWDSAFFRNSGWDASQATKFIKDQIPLAEKQMNNTKPQQASILPAGMTFITDPGRMSRSAMDGVDMVRDIVMQMYAQALNVPSSVLSSNTGITETFNTVDYRAFYKNQSATQVPVEKFFSILVTRGARAQGISGEAIFVLKRNDEMELEREAEIQLKLNERDIKELEKIEKARELGLPIPEDRLEAITEEMFSEDTSDANDLMIGRSQRTGARRLEIVRKADSGCCDTDDCECENESQEKR